MARRHKSPWLQDAAVGATGQTYEIRTVADFMKVPADRRRICLREFHAWMVFHEGITEILSLGEDPVPLDAMHWENDVYRWIDDGEGMIKGEMLFGDDAKHHPESLHGVVNSEHRNNNEPQDAYEQGHID